MSQHTADDLSRVGVYLHDEAHLENQFIAVSSRSLTLLNSPVNFTYYSFIRASGRAVIKSVGELSTICLFICLHSQGLCEHYMSEGGG